MALNPLLFLAFFQKRNKRFSVSFIEPAEHLVIFQTQYLDRYQQCLKAGNEDIRTTSIIAAWLTAYAPTRTKEIVLEK